jgi:hypothetical protein
MPIIIASAINPPVHAARRKPRTEVWIALAALLAIAAFAGVPALLQGQPGLTNIDPSFLPLFGP